MNSGRDSFDRSSNSFTRNNDTWTGQDSSFDNSDPFEFSAMQARLPEKDPGFIANYRHVALPVNPIVKVYIHEQLAALYDDVSKEGAVSIEGTVYVQATGRSPFCIVLRDLLEQIECVEEQAEVCINITDRVSSKGLHHADRVLRIALDTASPFRETIVLKYVCVPTLRPVPLVRFDSSNTMLNFMSTDCALMFRSFAFVR